MPFESPMPKEVLIAASARDMDRPSGERPKKRERPVEAGASAERDTGIEGESLLHILRVTGLRSSSSTRKHSAMLQSR